MSRPSEQNTIRLQPRDIQLMRGLFESRVLTLSQATALYFEAQSEPAKKRVQKLKAAGVIGERPRRLYEKSVLYLTNNGFALLTRAGHLSGFPRLTVADFESRSRVSELSLGHELNVQEVKVAFASGLKAANIRLKEFWTWPRLSQFRESSGNGPTVTVKPDGFMKIWQPDVNGDTFESVFFLEIDRGSENREQLAARARCYLNYYSNGGFAEWNGRPRSEYREFPFRVLIIFKTAERRNTMAVQLLDGRPQILTHSWLTTFGELAANPLGQIWVTPKDYLVLEEQYSRLQSAWDGRVFRREAAREEAIEAKIVKHSLLGSELV